MLGTLQGVPAARTAQRSDASVQRLQMTAAQGRQLADDSPTAGTQQIWLTETQGCHLLSGDSPTKIRRTARDLNNSLPRLQVDL